MNLLRIREVAPLGGYRLRLTLTDGSIVERDLTRILEGAVFDPLKADPSEFARVRVENGTLAWPNGADLCPDVVIWNGPPVEGQAPPATLALRLPARAS